MRTNQSISQGQQMEFVREFLTQATMATKPSVSRAQTVRRHGDDVTQQTKFEAEGF
jgi:hypothetical protein